MKTTVTMIKNGLPMVEQLDQVGNSPVHWIDHGSAYSLFGILDALGLPTPVELVKRESVTFAGLYLDSKNEVEYAPDWRRLLAAFESLERNIKNAIERTDDMLVIMVRENRDTIYAEHPVKSGIDALAMYADVKERRTDDKVRGVQNKFGHFYIEQVMPVRSIIRGVTCDEDGIYVPCVYVVFDGNMNKLVDQVKMWKMMCEIALADDDKYTIRVKTEKIMRYETN
jgi:hypothetical protein